jgi:hypothetical protein
VASRTEISTFTVKLDPVLLGRFKAACALRDRSMSEVTREFVAWYVERKEGALSEPPEPQKRPEPPEPQAQTKPPAATPRQPPAESPFKPPPSVVEEEYPPEPPAPAKPQYQSDLLRRMRGQG